MGQHSSRPTFQDTYDEKRRDRFRKHRPSRLNLRGSAVDSPLSVPQSTDSRPPSLKSVRSKKITGILRRVRSSGDVRHRPLNGTTLHEVVPVPPLPFVLQRHLPSPTPFLEHALPPYAQDISQPGFTVLSSCSQTVCPAVTPQLKPFNTSPPNKPAVPEAANAEVSFRAAYPEYASTLPLDFLRNAEYSRLRPGEVYVDSMGGALYPELLIRAHAEFLEKAVLGNTHSQSSSSQLSTSHATAAREAVLSHFNAPVGSKVIFTANASQALKLVGESFPFGSGSTYLLPEDAHNSVHGIREFARRAGAEVVYMPGRPGRGGIDVARARVLLDANAPLRGDAALAAFTGLSNLTNTKISLGPIASPNSPSHEHKRSTSNISLPTPPSSATAASFSFLYLHPSQEPAVPVKDAAASYHPSLLTHAKSLGYTTLLDAAALAPTSTLDLSTTPIDAVAISFYKMFGYPTGIGALILAPGVGEFLLQPGRSGAGGRPWFAGGTVDVVQVPGNVISRTKVVEEAFEDGTLNYLQLPAIPVGLNLLRSYLPFLPTRLAALAHFLATELSLIKHANGALGARVLSRVPGQISSVGGVERHRLLPPVRNTGHAGIARMPPSAWETDEDRDGEGTGGTVSFVVLEPNGDQVPLSTIGASAAANNIMLRTGCMCNPGGAAAVLGIAPFMAQLRAGATLHALEEAAGHELGVVRVSFGLVSSWEDAWAVVCWARKSVAENWAGFREAATPGWRPAVAL